MTFFRRKYEGVGGTVGGRAGHNTSLEISVCCTTRKGEEEEEEEDSPSFLPFPLSSSCLWTSPPSRRRLYPSPPSSFGYGSTRVRGRRPSSLFRDEFMNGPFFFFFGFSIARRERSPIWFFWACLNFPCNNLRTDLESCEYAGKYFFSRISRS